MTSAGERPGDPRPSEDALAANRALWEAWTPIHEGSDFYDLEGFKRGGIRLREYELAEMGPVAGREVLHLQCHFGLDTLSFARLGARATGVDFSAAAIRLARTLADELGLEARFVESSLDALPSRLEGDFDLVYTSRGVLSWLPDLGAWARLIAHYLRPGGQFYISEVHPVANALHDDGEDAGDAGDAGRTGELALRWPYFDRREPLRFPVQGSYADPDADVPQGHGFDLSLIHI